MTVVWATKVSAFVLLSTRRQASFVLAGAILWPLPVCGESAPAESESRRKLRSISNELDRLQEDVFNSNWAAVAKYPPTLRSYVPLLTEYTDSVFPADTAAGRESRVAMRYEVGKFFTSVDRLTEAAAEKKPDLMQQAFANMSLAFDRYVKAGGLYDGSDPVVNYEVLYEGISDGQLVYLSPTTRPPRIKDPVLIIAGPDKGRTGIMIGVAQGRGSRERPDLSVVKFDGGIGEGEDRIKEIKAVPYGMVARQKLGPQGGPRDPFSVPPL